MINWKRDESGTGRDESGTGWDESARAWDESAAGRWFFAAVAAISAPGSSVADAWVHSKSFLPEARVTIS